ncbi:MAG TPA: Mur ligase family protein [Gemmatimonadales bacterium]|nr:Mur ligase family protein [Gemmatimonadales bacterium]
MTFLDSRRLTGPGLLLDGPGAILEIQLDDPQRSLALAAWRRAARRMLDAVGWSGETLATRIFAGGASLALSAPADALYAATEVNEWAWAAAEAEIQGGPEPDFVAAADRIRAAIREEQCPALLALRDAARARGLTFLSDEEGVSVGAGTGALVWPLDRLPEPGAVDWDRVHEIPTALVTGSNGKTTVVRLLAAMVAETGQITGTTSTDAVTVGRVTIAQGDYSGPEGARMLLRRPEVEAAVLETARGGLLRRGLTVERADVAVVTNIASDHLGEFGVQDLGALAETKLLVTRAVGPEGGVVLNADDPVLVVGAATVQAPVIWFSLEPDRPTLLRHIRAGGAAAVCAGDDLLLATGDTLYVVGAISDLPMAQGGAARHNVANALAAMAAAQVLGVPVEVMGRVLRRFGGNAEDNPGRANVMELGGVVVVIDFAHNPHGVAALVRMAASFPARRRLLLLGQAGDRSDADLSGLARAAVAFEPDRIVLKEMEHYRRGRQPGEVPRILADELQQLGFPAGAIAQAGSELDGVREALSWARAGDLLLLTVHEDRAAVVGLLERLRAEGWRAGEAVPG